MTPPDTKSAEEQAEQTCSFEGVECKTHTGSYRVHFCIKSYAAQQNQHAAAIRAVKIEAYREAELAFDRRADALHVLMMEQKPGSRGAVKYSERAEETLTCKAVIDALIAAAAPPRVAEPSKEPKG